MRHTRHLVLNLERGANSISVDWRNLVQVFHNKAEASQDAIRIGRLHCLQDQWSQALVSYMQCGGPVLLQRAVEQKMSSVAQKTLVLWGEQDTILERSNLELVKGSIDDVTVQV